MIQCRHAFACDDNQTLTFQQQNLVGTTIHHRHFSVFPTIISFFLSVVCRIIIQSLYVAQTKVCICRVFLSILIALYKLSSLSFCVIFIHLAKVYSRLSTHHIYNNVFVAALCHQSSK